MKDRVVWHGRERAGNLELAPAYSIGSGKARQRVAALAGR